MKKLILTLLTFAAITAHAATVVSNCGTGAALAAQSTDANGTITVGTSDPVTQIPIRSCTLTFNVAFSAAPACVTNTGTVNLFASCNVVSTTAVTFVFNTNAAGAVFRYFIYTGAPNVTSSIDCGATGTCANTVQQVRVVTGTGTLVTGTPSTFAVTAISPAFTSSSTYRCFAQDTTTIAVNIGVLTAGYVSGSAVTFTGPDTNTNTFRYWCVGS